MNKEWKYPYMIQRLERPTYIDGEVVVCPFSFGGGLTYGGIPKEAMDIIKNVFTFDYMGSAEFEFGEVPRALQAIVDHREDFVCGEIKFTGKPYQTYDVPEGKKNRKFIEKSAREATVYFFCHKNIFGDVHDFLVKIREDEHSFSFKEFVGFKDAMFPEENYSYKSDVENKRTPRNLYDRYVGWLDLGNRFMFFIDKGTFESSKIIFGIKENEND